MKISAARRKKKINTDKNVEKILIIKACDDKLQAFSPLLARCITLSTHTKQPTTKNTVCLIENVRKEEVEYTHLQKTEDEKKNTQHRIDTPLNIAHLEEKRTEKKK